MKKILLAAAVIGAALTIASVPADARGGGGRAFHAGGHGWHGGGRGWHGGGRGWNGGWGWGAAGAGLAAGALLGSALTAPYYDGSGAYAYEPAPGYGGGGVGYCMQRFRSYDPASGTYLGYDGMRHPCP